MKKSKGDIIERYNIGQSSLAGISAGVDLFILSLAILFFILEFFLLFYAISIAFKCTKPGPERVVHVTLSIVFTLPYILISAFFNKCAQDTLKNNNIFMTPLTKSSIPKFL